MIRVALVDDHALIRRGLRDSLNEAGDIRVVGEASDYGELRQLLRDTEFDVLLLDINLPGRSGLDVLHSLADHPVHAGRKFITPAIAEALAERLSVDESHAAHERLSDREFQTLIRLASGKRLSDIATELNLSPKTVSVYRARVLEKLSVQTNAELTTYCLKNGLID